MTSKFKALIIGLGFGLGAVNAWAEQPSAVTEVQIDADKQQALIKENITIFDKNVHIVHGQREIKADRLEAHRRPELGDNKQLLIATGNPAIYSETMADGTQITASAKEIRYDVATQMLQISGTAKIAMADQQIVAETISYDINKQLISAEKDKDSSTRVRTTLTPQTDEKKEKEQP
ncbi:MULTISPECIES: lipopolysaccharide transport periplasmic protein LptA [unclassified Pseudoalteromonas]|uniref:lipopolysaccharide transport periplasmic protein LptA n=1 Tax=unclassified Pseudoalteromonas TaxID=194690 RepID=UPI000CF5DE69|nr:MULTISPECIES: lipopolysaccharide transport periplasmic protein LptA [unclassified Pseudoalteromonas]MBS3797273.1 lipopolysaccharide transport periplasmic protein LptA [Pseudoalteromonas sp. BDTF-M6]